MRECGGCTICCKLVGVDEIGKPAGEWCGQCEIGKGCRIYLARPEPCRAFRCLWLQIDNMPDELRPDRSRVVLTTTTDGENVVAIVDPRETHRLSTGMMGNYLHGMGERGVGIIAIHGDGRTILSLTPKLEAKLVQIEQGRESTL
jgi:hypothetical protein